MSCNFLCSAGGNQSAFVPQAMATMCWGGDVGGGFLRGQTSLLTCTASDTCALNALDADQASSLVSCGSCPVTAGGGIFACDKYLRRCTCGAYQSSAQPCKSSSDCAQTGAMCGLSDVISGVSTAFVTPLCTTCGSLGMEPVCVVNSLAEGGYCTCGNVRSSVLSCATPGARTHITSAALCLIALQPSLVGVLNGLSPLSAAFTMPWSDFAIASCLVAGGYQVFYRLPIGSFADGPLIQSRRMSAPACSSLRPRVRGCS